MSEKVRNNDSKFWLVPPEIYGPLNKEFNFDFDPCPYPFEKDGIETEWGGCNWINPPFRAKDSINGNGPTAFVRKAIQEQKKGKTSVLILPVISLLNMLFEAKAEIRAQKSVHRAGEKEVVLWMREQGKDPKQVLRQLKRG